VIGFDAKVSVATLLVTDAAVVVSVLQMATLTPPAGLPVELKVMPVMGPFCARAAPAEANAATSAQIASESQRFTIS
jgi:hypothetical protein